MDPTAGESTHVIIEYTTRMEKALFLKFKHYILAKTNKIKIKFTLISDLYYFPIREFW